MTNLAFAPCPIAGPRTILTVQYKSGFGNSYGWVTGMNTLVAHQNEVPAGGATPSEVLAEGLTLRTRRGVVYENVDLAVGRGALVAVMGPSGSGRTALLLGLAGRMRFTQGSATVCGLDVSHDARRVRRTVGLSVFPGVNDLDETTSIQTQVRAELILHRLPHDDRAVHELLERFGVHAAPHEDIGSLDRGEQLLLGVGLGLLHQPRVLMVDNADLNLTGAEQEVVWRALRKLGDEGITVMATCVDRPAPGRADVIYDMGVAR
jgi:ABC-2 type transport system ATP-binding protein